mgnify:CR=1 FL=1
MKAAKLTEHPSFRLMRQTDVQNVWHMQMPRWLFSDPRYADMSLDAKVAYTFLLNRFQLSRRNGWVNDAGEVFVIFPRKALAKELGPSGIRVNCIAPGAIATRMNDNLDEEAVALLREETPLGRMGTPEEIAKAIAFLALEDSAFTTGQVLSPNGGLVI